MTERDNGRERENMSAREGQWVTDMGDKQGEIMGDRKRERSGERERKNAREREGRGNGERSNREWKHMAPTQIGSGYQSEKVGKRGAAGSCSPRESRTDTENV